MPGPHSPSVSPHFDMVAIWGPCIFPPCSRFTTLQHAILKRIFFLLRSAAAGDRKIVKAFTEIPRLLQSLLSGQFAPLSFLLIFANSLVSSKTTLQNLPCHHCPCTDHIIVIITSNDRILPSSYATSPSRPDRYFSCYSIIADQRVAQWFTTGSGDPSLSLEVCPLWVFLCQCPRSASIENRN